MPLSLLRRFSLLLLLFSLNSNGGEVLTDAVDLQRLGASEPNEVILLMISQDNCGFCVRVKEDYLKPLVASDTSPPVRVLHLGKNQQVIDFDGQIRLADTIANRLGGRFTPTLIFTDAKGTPLHDPIVGLTTPDFYGYYLDEAIADSRKRLN